MRCVTCHKPVKKETTTMICPRCETRLKHNLEDLIQLHKEAHYCLQPQKGSSGSNSGEPTSGVNLHALDFVSGNRIFNILHEWEKLIRHERKLTLPAFLPKYGSIEEEVKATVHFHVAHLDWSIQQEWVNDYVLEIAELHSFGMTAARRFLDPVKRIPCPTDLDDDKLCSGLIPVKGNDVLETVLCNRCGTTWTAARLIAVAMSDPRLEIWLDAEAISHWVGIGERQVLRIVAKNDVPKKGALIELQSFMKVRDK